MRYRTAIVTGASRGLGLAVARAFAERGLNVVLAARTEPAELREHWIETDASSAASIRALVAQTVVRHGPVDVLVNNAGIGTAHPFVDSTEDEIRATVDLNLTGLMLCTLAVLPGMLEQQRGLIVNVGSDLSRRFNPNMAVYTATKFGLLGFSGSLLREVKDAGVRVTAVLPGVIDTSFGGFAPEASRGAQYGIPPGELAETIAALLDLPEHLVMDEITLHPSGQSHF